MSMEDGEVVNDAYPTLLSSHSPIPSTVDPNAPQPIPATPQLVVAPTGTLAHSGTGNEENQQHVAYSPNAPAHVAHSPDGADTKSRFDDHSRQPDRHDEEHQRDSNDATAAADTTTTTTQPTTDSTASAPAAGGADDDASSIAASHNGSNSHVDPSIQRLWIGNVPNDMTEADIRAIFAGGSAVIDNVYPKNGYAFVHFSCTDGLREMIQKLDGVARFGQNTLRIQISSAPPLKCINCKLEGHKAYQCRKLPNPHINFPPQGLKNRHERDHDRDRFGGNRYTRDGPQRENGHSRDAPPRMDENEREQIRRERERDAILARNAEQQSQQSSSYRRGGNERSRSPPPPIGAPSVPPFSHTRPRSRSRSRSRSPGRRSFDSRHPHHAPPPVTNPPSNAYNDYPQRSAPVAPPEFYQSASRGSQRDIPPPFDSRAPPPSSSYDRHYPPSSVPPPSSHDFPPRGYEQHDRARDYSRDVPPSGGGRSDYPPVSRDYPPRSDYGRGVSDPHSSSYHNAPPSFPPVDPHHRGSFSSRPLSPPPHMPPVNPTSSSSSSYRRDRSPHRRDDDRDRALDRDRDRDRDREHDRGQSGYGAPPMPPTTAPYHAPSTSSAPYPPYEAAPSTSAAPTDPAAAAAAYALWYQQLAAYEQARAAHAASTGSAPPAASYSYPPSSSHPPSSSSSAPYPNYPPSSSSSAVPPAHASHHAAPVEYGSRDAYGGSSSYNSRY